MTTLRPSHQHLPGITMIVLDGELDATNHEHVRNYLDRVRQQPTDHVVFDLSTVSFLDVSGIRLLLSTHITTTLHGAEVHLAAPTPALSRALQITGVTDRVRTHDTLDQALQAALTAIAARSN